MSISFATWVEQNLFKQTTRISRYDLIVSLYNEKKLVVNHRTNGTSIRLKTNGTNYLFIENDFIYGEIFFSFKPDMLSKSGKSIYYNIDIQDFLDLGKFHPNSPDLKTYDEIKSLIRQNFCTYLYINPLQKKLPEKALKIPDFFLHHFPIGFAFESEIDGKMNMLIDEVNYAFDFLNNFENSRP
jgi:hypothetical protein